MNCSRYYELFMNISILWNGFKVTPIQHFETKFSYLIFEDRWGEKNLNKEIDHGVSDTDCLLNP